jgi:Ice-binding-like/IPTL-CTERM motif
MARTHSKLVAGLTFAALLYGASPASAQAVAPGLGSEATFGVVSSTFTNSNTAPQTIINGSACFTTGPATAPLLVTGAYGACPASAGTDQTSALSTLNTQPCTSLGAIVALDNAPGHPTGVYTPGCYSSTGAMNITLSTTVTLSGAGVYVFRSAGALTTGANSLVTLAGGACESDVFWAPVAGTTIGANAAPSATPTFRGSILDAAGITIGHFANLTGRALAFGGTVTTDANTISVPTCAAFSGGGGGVPPTVAKAFNPSSNGPGGVSTLTITLANANATAATLSTSLVDPLPSGVVVAPSPNASTTCGGTVTATAGGSSITLSQAGSTIPASGSCTVVANVTSATAGTYTNTIGVSALSTSNGFNTVAASAVLTISAAITPVPTLSEWAMIMLAALLCLCGFFAIRRRGMTA